MNRRLVAHVNGRSKIAIINPSSISSWKRSAVSGKEDWDFWATSNLYAINYCWKTSRSLSSYHGDSMTRWSRWLA